jgi:hypothetical protein
MDVSVTIPIVVSETHFQNTTPSATDVRLDLLLRLNIGMHARAMDVVGQIRTAA